MPTIDELMREAAVPVVIASQRGLITYVNERFEAMLGWRSDEIVGRPLTTIIPERLRDAHHLGFSRFLSSGAPRLLNRPLRLMTVTKAGAEVEAEHFLTAERRRDEWVFGATIRPV